MWQFAQRWKRAQGGFPSGVFSPAFQGDYQRGGVGSPIFEAPKRAVPTRVVYLSARQATRISVTHAGSFTSARY